jgi:ferredoxin
MDQRTLSLNLSDPATGNLNTPPHESGGSEQTVAPSDAAEHNLLARCSFCGLGEGEVERLFQGREGYICGECVDVCMELIADFREMGMAPPESKRSWYQRWFSEEIHVTCSFTPHDEENPQGERLFPGMQVQICEQCIRACAALISGEGAAAQA